MKKLILALGLLCIANAAHADVAIKSGQSSATLSINANNAAKVVNGLSDRPTYVASISGHATTAAMLLTIEAGPTKTIKIINWCVSTSQATANAAGTITVRRTTAASSAGTVLVNEGTGTATIAKLDPADGSFSGVGRLDGTPGTAGATLDQVGFTTAQPAGGPSPIFCKTYNLDGEKAPIVQAGTTNGFSINVTAAGSGGLANGSINVVFIEE